MSSFHSDVPQLLPTGAKWGMRAWTPVVVNISKSQQLSLHVILRCLFINHHEHTCRDHKYSVSLLLRNTQNPAKCVDCCHCSGGLVCIIGCAAKVLTITKVTFSARVQDALERGSRMTHSVLSQLVEFTCVQGGPSI